MSDGVKEELVASVQLIASGLVKLMGWWLVTTASTSVRVSGRIARVVGMLGAMVGAVGAEKTEEVVESVGASWKNGCCWKYGCCWKNCLIDTLDLHRFGPASHLGCCCSYPTTTGLA